jgi:DNA-directed RNA polymerase subunit RPC12/RpoP
MLGLLKCPSCRQKSAFVTTKGKLEKLTGVKNSGELFFKTEVISGVAGVAALELIKFIPIDALIDLVKTVFNKTFGWFEDSNKKYIVCRECGHYELLEKPEQLKN